jgi:hypothetical protein
VVVVIKVVMELLVELLMNCVIDEEEGGRGRGERRMKFHMYTARTGSERERERELSLFSAAHQRHTHTDSTRARRLEWKRSHSSSSTDVICGPSSWKEKAVTVQYWSCTVYYKFHTDPLRKASMDRSFSLFLSYLGTQDHHAPQKYTTIADWTSTSSSPGHAS